MQKLIVAGLFVAAAACAQNISVGALAGVPIMNVESATTVSGITSLPKSPNFVAGAALQVNLPAHLRLEVDGIFRPATFKLSSLASNTSANEWRFPVILQYRQGRNRGVRPFFGLGASFDHLYNIKNAVTSGPGSIASNSAGGMILDAGLDFKLFLFRLSAEARYTRQANAPITSVSQLNQAEILVGAHF